MIRPRGVGRSRTIRGGTGKTLTRLDIKKQKAKRKGLKRRGKIRKAVVVCCVVEGSERGRRM